MRVGSLEFTENSHNNRKHTLSGTCEEEKCHVSLSSESELDHWKFIAHFFYFNKPIFILSINVPPQFVLLLTASLKISPCELHLLSRRALAASQNPPPPHAVNPLEKVQADHACIPSSFDPAFGHLPWNHVIPTNKIHQSRFDFSAATGDPCASRSWCARQQRTRIVN